MSELLDSRCKVCSKHNFQCKACRSCDKETLTTARLAKKGKQLSNVPPMKLFPTSVAIALTSVAPHSVAIAPVALVPVAFSPVAHDYEVDHVFPPMPPALPVSIFGQQVYPAAPTDDYYNEAFSDVESAFPPSPPSPSTRVRSFTSPPSSKKRKMQKPKNIPSISDSDSNSGSTTTVEDGEDDEACDDASDAEAAHKDKKAKMPRITQEERSTVCMWIVKLRPDAKMNNGRWIRNGGAKGATMTVTSGEVKTSGAYDALAK
jgi:hypothetical protein